MRKTIEVGILLAFSCSSFPAWAQSVFTVDRLTDAGEGDGLVGDLRYCITNATDGDGITFVVTGTINLTRALPDLTRSISIEGPGANVVAVRRNLGGEYRIFTVGPGNVSVNISGLTITNGRLNGYSFGGGIYNSATLTLANSTVERNGAAGQFGDGFGGGIYNSGILTITNSTISRNQAGNESVTGDTGAGGGVYNSGTLVIANSTISGNGAGGGSGFGGGIYNAGPTLSITNSTISGNGADSGGGISNYPSSLQMRNTMLGGNIATLAPDLDGRLSSSGYNLIRNTSGGSGFDQETDLLNVDPMLGPLQDNGGSTFTYALLPGSPAIDAGDPDFISPPDFDQRGEGFPRIVNRLDIGAFEVQGAGGERR